MDTLGSPAVCGTAEVSLDRHGRIKQARCRRFVGAGSNVVEVRSRIASLFERESVNLAAHRLQDPQKVQTLGRLCSANLPRRAGSSRTVPWPSGSFLDQPASSYSPPLASWLCVH